MDEKQIIYIDTWFKTEQAYSFRFSNKILQVFFVDKTEMILSYEMRIVVYVNKMGENSTYSLETTLEDSNQEITKKLNYILETNNNKLNQGNKPST